MGKEVYFNEEKTIFLFIGKFYI